METTYILEMTNKEIIRLLTMEEQEQAKEIYKTLENFCDNYQDGARLGGEDVYFSPSEYLKIIMDTRY